MAVLQMQKISICALKKDRKAILEKLQSLGVLEIQSEIEDDSFQKMDTGSARQSFEKMAHLAEQGLEILGQYVPEKNSMLSGLEGKRLIEEEQLQKMIELLRGQQVRVEGHGKIQLLAHEAKALVVVFGIADAGDGMARTHALRNEAGQHIQFI